MIPDRPTPAQPAAKTPAKTVNTTTLAGVLAASKPKPPVPSIQDSLYAQTPGANLPGTKKPGKTKEGLGDSTKTGSIETGIVDKTTQDTGSTAGKPLEVVFPQEEMDAVQSASDALRTFQENQSRLQLQTALGKIDRAAIDQYKGIANDYAARGMARSGGKLVTEQRAVSERDRAVNEATQAVTDFINELKLTGNLEQARTNLSKSQAFQDYISGRLTPAMGG